jgi:hypothetical protein
MKKLNVRPRELTAAEKKSLVNKSHAIAHAGFLLVRKQPHEGGQFLRSEGETVTSDSYWLRRLKSGDVEIVKAPKAAKPASK